jgi:hypothetical protein
MTLDEIKNLGARKYFDDQGIYRNPYAAGSPEFNEFERGWMQSLKKDEGRFVGETERIAKRQSNGISPTATDIAAERYRSRKG